MYNKVYVEITNICNMNCSFCHGHSRAPRQMSEKEFTYILGQLKGQTEYIYYHLMGEPLTHPLLPRFLELAKDEGFSSIITTNGTLLKKRGAEILAAGLHKVHQKNKRDAAEKPHPFSHCAVADHSTSTTPPSLMVTVMPSLT